LHLDIRKRRKENVRDDREWRYGYNDAGMAAEAYTKDVERRGNQLYQQTHQQVLHHHDEEWNITFSHAQV